MRNRGMLSVSARLVNPNKFPTLMAKARLEGGCAGRRFYFHRPRDRSGRMPDQGRRRGGTSINTRSAERTRVSQVHPHSMQAAP